MKLEDIVVGGTYHYIAPFGLRTTNELKEWDTTITELDVDFDGAAHVIGNYPGLSFSPDAMGLYLPSELSPIEAREGEEED